MSENPHYAERSDDETSAPTGGGVEPDADAGQEHDEPQVGGVGDGPGSHGEEPDTGHGGHAQHAGTALSGEDAPHPAGDGERSDREVGGPRAAEDAPRTEAGEGELPGGAKGDIATKGMDPHE